MKHRCNYTRLEPIEKVIPNPRNPNTHPEGQIELLAKIIDFQGWRSPIVVSKSSGFIVRGHGRLLAAQRLNLKKVPIDVQVYDNEAQEWADLVADNRIAELAEMDRATLKDLIEELDTGELDLDLTGFDEASLEDLMSEFFVPEEGNTDEDEIPEEVEARTKPGDLWELGDHRLLCGDCTKVEDVVKVMGGEIVEACVTDPPYGMKFQSHRRKEKHQRIAGDGSSDLLYFASSIEATHSLYVFCRWDNLPEVPVPKSLITWVKNIWSMGDLDHEHARQTEVCLFYPGKSHKWSNGRPSDVVRCERSGNELHPTEKPVLLLQEVIGWTAGKVFDPFLGSGTTLIAAQRLERICYGIEIDPHYCDVAIQRWEDFTGKKARKVKK